MNIRDCFVGMRFVVTDAGARGMYTYNDYENGDTGRVRRLSGSASDLLFVDWDNRRYQDERQEDSRCDCLSCHEIDRVDP